MVLKLGRCSTAAAVWRRLTAEEAEAGLVCPQVKMVAVCQSIGSSSQTEDFQRKLESPDMLYWLSSPVAEATDGGLECFVCVKVNVSGLEGPAYCWSSTTVNEVSCPLDCYCCPLLATWLCLAGRMIWLEGISVSGMVKMYSLAAGAGCCGC